MLENCVCTFDSDAGVLVGKLCNAHQRIIDAKVASAISDVRTERDSARASQHKLAVDYEKLQYLFAETTGDVLEFVIENEGAMEHAIFIKLVGMLRAPETAK